MTLQPRRGVGNGSRIGAKMARLWCNLIPICECKLPIFRRFHPRSPYCRSETADRGQLCLTEHSGIGEGERLVECLLFGGEWTPAALSGWANRAELQTGRRARRATIWRARYGHRGDAPDRSVILGLIDPSPRTFTLQPPLRGQG